MQTEFAISTKTHPATLILAGVLDGTLRPWRTDIDNVVWYQRVPPIHGGPVVDAGDAIDNDPGEEESFDDED